MNLLKKNNFLFTIVVFSIFAITPLLRPDFFVSNELLGPVYRLVELDVSIKDGDLFPRWSPDLYGGLGGPLFHYYAPFSYYVAELFHLTGLGFIKSIKATYAASFILSGVFMYIFAKNRMNKNGAFVAGILYMYAPYRFESVYTRGAFTEAFTFIFLPLILLAFHKIATQQKIDRYFALGSLSLAALIFCHNIIALFFTGFLVVYLLFLTYEFPSSKTKTFSAVVMGLGLSSFFWIP
ncbi:glycosyltransferase family 39 protein, partial [archaeon]|nr:glycosyltransferase family 39 protein [archaeon]